jgi:metallophosphoesterase (TIGR00282 family)
VDTFSILMIGDIVGKPGMLAVRKTLPRLIADRRIDFIVANGENTAGGIGITPELANELLCQEIGCITSGNHIWRQREIRPFIDREDRLLRPLNFPAAQPGNGFGLYESSSGVTVGVVNLAGRVFMDPADSPFEAADRALDALCNVNIVLVDFHAEATSEKRAMALYLQGRVTAVIGTHTHVQTADAAVLGDHTAFITDVGMTGPHDSVIGMRKDLVMERFVRGLPHAFKVAKNDVRFQAALISIERASGKALGIERIDIPVR